MDARHVVCGRILFDEVTQTSVDLPAVSNLFVVAMVAGKEEHRLILRDERSDELASLCLESSGKRPCFLCGSVSQVWPPDAASCVLNAVGLSILASQAKGGDEACYWRLRSWCERRTRSKIAKSRIGRLVNAEEEIVDRVLNRVQKNSIPKFDPSGGRTWPRYFDHVYTSVISSHLPGDRQVTQAVGCEVHPVDPHPGPLDQLIAMEDSAIYLLAIKTAPLTAEQHDIMRLNLSGIDVNWIAHKLAIPVEQVYRERAKARITIQQRYIELGGK